MQNSGTIFPSLSYDDARTAIEWLCRVFGFQERLLLPGEGSAVKHAELSFGEGVLLISSARPGEGRLSPAALPGVTSALSLYVEDPGAHFERAQREGAEIVQPLTEESFGARGYMARDPEGHLWYFGDYRPGEFWETSTS